MSKFIRMCIAGLIVSLVEISPVVAGDWTGGYMGFNGGLGTSSIKTDINPVGTVSVSDFDTRTMRTRANGTLFGIQGGYNWQANNLVYGVEGDIDASGLSGTRQDQAPSKLNLSGSVDGFTTTDKIDWLASIRGRMGFLAGPGMAYVTGGIAWEGLSRKSLVNAEVAPGVYGVTSTTNSSGSRVGYVLGAGYEVMLDQRLSVRGEYLFYNFEHTNNDAMSFTPCATPGECNANVATHANNISALRVGVDYKF